MISILVGLACGALVVIGLVRHRRAVKQAYEDGYRVGLHRGAEILSANIPGLQSRLGDLTKVKR